MGLEHTALGRRFREFVIAHVRPDYFRTGLNPADYPLARTELQEVLAWAYEARSKYVHQLKRLPRVLTLGHGFSDTTEHEHSRILTIQGLAKLMRHVILEFVMRQKTVEREVYDYRGERSGVVQLRMAPEYWVGNVDGDISRAGKVRLAGFLEQLCGCFLNGPTTPATDLRPLLARVSEIAPSLSRELRRPYLALHAIFNCVSGTNAAPLTADMTKFIEVELAGPSVESMFAHLVCGQAANWPIEQHHEVLNTYIRKRASKNGLRIVRLFESAAILELVERYRLAGNFESARTLVSLAVENHPGHVDLQNLENNFNGTDEVNWKSVLLSRLKNATE